MYLLIKFIIFAKAKTPNIFYKLKNSITHPLISYNMLEKRTIMNNSKFSFQEQKNNVENNPEPSIEEHCKYCTQIPGVLNPLEDWLDSHDVIALLHISPRTLHTLRRNGTLPYSQLGRKIYHKRSDIQRILHDNYTIFELRNGKK